MPATVAAQSPPPLDSSALDALVLAAEAAADVAGAAIRPFYRSPFGVDDKADSSPVTIADRTAELAMRAVLSQRCPDMGILGEEFGLDRADAPLRWVLDPIDGTRAFITGRPLFGTLIGLLGSDAPLLGVLDQPITGERWVGVRGRATRFRGGHGRAGCRPCPAMSGAEMSCTSPSMVQGADAAPFARLLGAARRVTWGGDCYAYGLLALGHVDLIAEADLKVWDWAALVPIVEGAGGRMTDWRGKPLHPDGDGRALAVGDAALLDQAVALLAR